MAARNQLVAEPFTFSSGCHTAEDLWATLQQSPTLPQHCSHLPYSVAIPVPTGVTFLTHLLSDQEHWHLWLGFDIDVLPLYSPKPLVSI